LVWKSSLTKAFVLSIFIVVATGARLTLGDTVGGTYISVTPSAYVAEKLGETFVISVQISNVQNLRVFEFKLGYNATLVEATGVVQGSFFPPAPESSVEKLQINKTTGFVWVWISLSDSQPAMDGSGTLAQITFNVTFAPRPPEQACCVLSLYGTLLYDDSMRTITHDSAAGLYFYGSVQPDPIVDGLILDVYTQKGGKGQGTPGGTFKLLEIVQLNSTLTYDGYPVQSKLVAFQALDPTNKTVLILVAITDYEGVASESFRIPNVVDSPGKWTVIATAGVADKVVWDWLTFNVTYAITPYGPKANFVENTELAYELQTVEFNATSSLPSWNGTNIMPITEYRWDFGDGNKTTTQTPIICHSHKQAGTYYVTLTVYAPGATPATDTAPAQRKVVLPPSVGGYSILIQRPVIERSPTLCMALLTIQAAVFTIVGRKAHIKKLHYKVAAYE
jgi:hypothetical protein